MWACLLNLKEFRQNLILISASHGSSQTRMQCLKSHRQSWLRQPNFEHMYPKDPGSWTLVVYHKHVCTSVHMNKCILVLAHLDMTFVITISIPWAYLMNFPGLLWKKYKRLDHCRRRTDASHHLVGVYGICKMNSQDEWNLRGVLQACSVQSGVSFWVSVAPGRYLALCPGPVLERSRPRTCWMGQEGSRPRMPHPSQILNARRKGWLNKSAKCTGVCSPFFPHRNTGKPRESMAEECVLSIMVSWSPKPCVSSSAIQMGIEHTVTNTFVSISPMLRKSHVAIRATSISEAGSRTGSSLTWNLPRLLIVIDRVESILLIHLGNRPENGKWGRGLKRQLHGDQCLDSPHLDKSQVGLAAIL